MAAACTSGPFEVRGNGRAQAGPALSALSAEASSPISLKNCRQLASTEPGSSRKRVYSSAMNSALALGRAQQGGALLLGGAADLADHDDCLGLVVGEKHLQHVGEVEPVDRVAADADAARLSQPGGGRLRYGLIGQRAGARHDADPTA